ncbi:MAG: YjjG family noncanonical pyrimidine nucleotidase [Bacteroidales bacterium]|nr:YjjG family noncanonical pyrimidine nucleotidase [Candidatus Equibacterium intestinale]
MIIDRYRFFLFDIDRTLWDFDANAHVALRTAVTNAAVGVTEENFEEFFEVYEPHNQYLWDEYERGRITKDFLKQDRIFTPLKMFCGMNDIARAMEISEDYLYHMALSTKLMDGAAEVLEAIAARGGKMGIVSNGFKEVQRRKLAHAGIDKYFSAVIISDEVGVMKPSPEIFTMAVDALGGDIRETLMIGDNLANDIVGAREAGIDQFYLNNFNTPHTEPVTYESGSLKDLL